MNVLSHFNSKSRRSTLLIVLAGFTLLLPVVTAAQINPYSYSVNKKAECYKGAVVSAHPLASQVGLSILQKGGNAIDAAIATQLALAVVYPGAGNIGGGGFLVAHLNSGENITLDYREKAPGNASRNMFLDAAGNAKADESLQTHLAAGVPGTVAGLFAALKYARLPFKKLIQPAIDLADKGFAITASMASALNENREEFISRNVQPCAFVKDTPWQIGDILIQKELAATLKRIRDKGQAGFYEGATASFIVSAMRKGNGMISAEDLKNYQAMERKALVFDYHGHRVITMPLPSSGGILLQQMLGMIEDRDIGSLGFHSPASVQLMIEVERRAFADRGEYLGDADFVKVPVSTLVSKAYLQSRMKDFLPGQAGNSKDTQPGQIKESEETTHLSVIDAEGNAVAVTTTLNDSYGSKIVVAGAGFILNNEMDDFSIKPGVPNMYGAIGNDKNAIAPGKRMLSSMTPTIVLKDNLPFLVTGTPGGTTIPTSVFQTLVNVIDFGLGADSAVNQPKFHHQWVPDTVDVEKTMPRALIAALENMGYKLKLRGGIGRTELILIRNKKIIAVGDDRGDDAAEGY
ncbi:MAG: gamma-glutamyltransferase [Chitinophagaceae bacterium]|nr:gamma-glutamyltransferase [Chitinophagaceae bacterium]